MSRLCRIAGCTKTPSPQKRVCGMHRWRMWRHGNPNFTSWTAADPEDVQTVADRREPTQGLTRLEERLIARKLTDLDVSAEEIARIVGRSPRTIHRWRAQDRKENAA